MRTLQLGAIALTVVIGIARPAGAGVEPYWGTLSIQLGTLGGPALLGAGVVLSDGFGR